MNFVIPAWVVWFVAWANAICGIYLLFEKMEEVASCRGRQQIAASLQDLDLSKTLFYFPSQIKLLLNQIFNTGFFSLRSFRYSCALSYASFVVVMLSFVALNQEFQTNLANKGAAYTVVYIAALFLVVPLFNFIPDYISLAETRRVVSWMSEHPTARRICALLVADLIFSGLIFSIGSAVVLSIVFGLVSLFQYIFSETRPDFLQFRQGLAWLFDVSTLLGVSDYAIHKQLRAPINVYFYTTFTSSILIWIYAVSSFLLRVVRKVDFSRRFATKLDIEKKPLRCIGVAVIVFTTLCFLVAPFLR